MPRSRFDTRDGAEVRDAEGTELPDLKTAVSEACLYMSGLVRDHADHLWSRGRLVLSVGQVGGPSLFTVETVVRWEPEHEPRAIEPDQ